jgi:hypothetical protein
LPLVPQGSAMDYAVSTAGFLQIIVAVINAREAGFLAEGVL